MPCCLRYPARRHGPSCRQVTELIEKWDFSPKQLGGFSYWRLSLVSVLGLFLELLMIRWVSSELSVFAYFKNFVLIAYYLAVGTDAIWPTAG